MKTMEKADPEKALKVQTWFETRFAFGVWGRWLGCCVEEGVVVARVSCIKVG